MHAELALLEALRAQTLSAANSSAPFVPGYSGMFRRVAESVEKLLNLKVALDIGYEPAAEVRRAARYAILHLDEFEEYGGTDVTIRGRRFKREYAALRRFARYRGAA